MVNHTQTIRWLLLTNCLSVFDHFSTPGVENTHKHIWILVIMLMKKMGIETLPMGC